MPCPVTGCCETHSPLPVTVAQSLPRATSPWRLCTPHLHHQQPPPENPSYATWCHTSTSDDNHGPRQVTEYGISRIFLWEHQPCATSHPSKHHCRGQASRAASPSTCSPQCCLQGSLSHSWLHQVWCKSKSMLVKSLELSVSPSMICQMMLIISY